MTPLMLFVLAWVGGILLVPTYALPPVWFLLALPPALALLVGWGDHRSARRLSVVLVGFMLGSLRMAAAEKPITVGHVAFYRDRGTVAIEGTVVTEPDRRASDTRLRVRVESLTLDGGVPREVEGRLLVYAPLYPHIHYGDRLRAAGRLETPPIFEDFSFKDYLAREGIHALLRDADVTVLASHKANPVMDRLMGFKEEAHRILLSLLPEPQGALLSGILLGIDQGIPDALNEAFEITGTSHIVAISGFNLTMVAALVTRIARRFLQRRAGLLAALLAIWVYVVLVGANASVVRAGVMSSLIALGQQEQRRAHGPTSLAAAVLALSLVNPLALWDPGFQLSAAATLGMMLYVPPMTAWLTALLARRLSQEWAERIVGALSDVLIVTLAVQIATFGIAVGNFRAIALVSLLTNFLILPAQTLIMVFGGLALAAGLIFLPLGRLLAWIAWVFLAYTTEIVALTASLPLASVPVPEVTPVLVWGYYLTLGILTLPLLTANDHALGERLKTWREGLTGVLARVNLNAMAAGGAVVVLAIIYLVLRPDGKLHVAFLDTGEGDAAFIRTPEGRQVLIDGGSDPRQTLAEIGRQMPFWDRTLDLVILTSPDDDRLAGLIPVLERYDVAYVGYGPEVHESPSYDRWRFLLDRRPQGASGALRNEDVWDLGAGVALSVIWPPPDREGPLVLQLSYGETNVLLMGDATTVVEDAIVDVYGPSLQSQVLQLPRHGARTCCSVALLQAVAPELVVVQGDDLDDVVKAKLMTTPLYQTSQQGTVELVSDGSTVQVRTRR